MSDLPTGWAAVDLEDFAEIVMGQSPPGRSYNTQEEGLPFYQGKAEFGPLYPTVRKWTTEPTRIAEPEDVLISVRAPVGPTNLCPARSCIGRGLGAIRPRGGGPSRFLLYLLRHLEPEIAGRGTGSTFSAISGSILRSLRFALPPLAEQHRIVAAIEQHLSRLDAAVAGLGRVKALLPRYRAAVLKAAVEGRLVPEGELTSADSNGDLPAGWTSASLGGIGELQGGVQKQPKRRPVKNKYPFLRVANVGRGSLDLEDIHEIELFGQELERLRLERGDLLIVEGNGSPSEIGRMAIWDGSIPDCVHQNHLIRHRPGKQVRSAWIQAYWNSPSGRRRVLEVASSTSGLYTLSVRKVAGLPIPLPSLDQQDSIIAEVDRLSSIIGAAESAVDIGLARATALRQSILARAFRGELVPQDPNDEPAEALLERIRAERAGVVPVGKLRRTKRVAQHR